VDAFTERDAEAIVTRRAAVTILVLSAIIPVYGYLDLPVVSLPVRISRLVAVGWALLFLGILLMKWQRPPLVFTRIVFGLAPIPLLPMFWLLAHERNARGLPLELFIRENVVSLLLAALTPPSATFTILLICAFTLQGIALYSVGGIPIVRAAENLQPWTSALIGLSAVGLALYRAHRQREEVRLIVARERATALERLTRSFLAIRDIANTPLQTLEVSLSLLTARHPEDRDLASTMQRSVVRLRDLNHVLASEAPELVGTAGEESFDPMKAIQTPKH
jgi:hypothetical protein